ncbi:glycosyltransferase family 22 protein, partial [Saccharata proteae CBS 121410]
LIPTTILLHLYYAPYTKVEESFNIQAIHDILAHGVPTTDVNEFLAARYDHVSFPGSVPRTFVGALLLSGLSRPWVQWLASSMQLQILVRAALGLINSFALLSFQGTVSDVWGKTAGIWFVLLQASQFHVMYYASRTLPNIFAFALSKRNAMSTKHLRLSLYLLTVAGVIFRSELAILISTLAVYQFLQHPPAHWPRYIASIAPAGLFGLVIGLAVTVPIDTFFWRAYPSPMWPEFSGFVYNTIEGHASEWGTSPWHYYFANALPRLLLNPLVPLLLLPAAFVTDRPSRALIIPSLGFVAIYSALPHKEWRFIMYIIPALTAAASAGATRIWSLRSKSLLHGLVNLALVASIVASFAASTALLAISSTNYPGGAALTRLQTLAAAAHPPGAVVAVHLDNLACQSGVTHFVEEAVPIPAAASLLNKGKSHAARKVGVAWSYDKTDDAEILLEPAFWQRFDYALMERPEKAIGKWAVLDTIYGFDGIKLLRPGEEDEDVVGKEEDGSMVARVKKAWRTVEEVGRKVTGGWWVGIRMEPKIRILKRLQ